MSALSASIARTNNFFVPVLRLRLGLLESRRAEVERLVKPLPVNSD